MVDQLPRKNLCPFDKQPCIGLDCKIYLSLQGENPQNPEERMEGWDCALNWLVLATLDVRKQILKSGDGVQSELESYRNSSAQASAVALKTSVVALNVAMNARVRMIGEDNG